MPRTKWRFSGGGIVVQLCRMPLESIFFDDLNPFFQALHFEF